MGFKLFSIQMPTDYSEPALRRQLEKKLGTGNFHYRIASKGLDARNKRRIHWHLRVAVTSPAIKGDAEPHPPSLNIKRKSRSEKVLVTGSGPAGFFAALALQMAGFQVTLIERGLDVDGRADHIAGFEAGGAFSPVGNYAFGEGGAGTFSDGKLTSRSKRISLEKQFILDAYVRGGAPEEIVYMTHPHLGSDNLKSIVAALRREFESLGGSMAFNTQLQNLVVRNGRVVSAMTSRGEEAADHYFFATGHSAFDTIRLFIRHGMPFRHKNFAIGARVEHRQEIINQAQWGRPKLTGVKAAEYRLTAKAGNGLPVYTFCMCPGGQVVPAAAFDGQNLVNGMSLYGRDSRFANAACVAGLNLETLLGREVSAADALDWLETLETGFHEAMNGYRIPAAAIEDFMAGRLTQPLKGGSYMLGMEARPFWEWLPEPVVQAMREGLKEFNQRLTGFSKGQIMGLESKTSAPVQVVRDQAMRPEGFENCWVVGEGSGWSGGIVSSAADGLKAAMLLIDK